MTPSEIKTELTENTSQLISDYFVNLLPEVQNEFVVIAQREGIDKAKRELEDDWYSFQGQTK
jgi:hypothetical protein